MILGSNDPHAAQRQLLEENSFRPAGIIDQLVSEDFGLYAIRLREGATLPNPFGAVAIECGTRLLYLGQALDQTLPVRFLGNELRGKGNGTFLRSLGAVLGLRPAPGSLANNARKQNYRFSPPNREAIMGWINEHLEVSWVTLPRVDVHGAEVELIREHTPVLNLKDNPLKLPELALLREIYREIASGPKAAL